MARMLVAWIGAARRLRRHRTSLGTKRVAIHVGYRRPPERLESFDRKEIVMLSWAVTFLIVAVVAALFGFSGIAGTAVNIAWILAVVGIIAAIAFFVLGRRLPLDRSGR